MVVSSNVGTEIYFESLILMAAGSIPYFFED